MLNKEDEFIFPVRWANPADWKEMMTMVWETFLKFEADDYTQEGIDNFKDFITGKGLYESFLRGTYQVMVVKDAEKIVGMASVRNHNHLSLLFVAEAYHGRGIGRRLIMEVCRYLKQTGESCVTVEAAPYAVRFYEKLGFRAVCQEEVYAGIRVTPMKKFF